MKGIELEKIKECITKVEELFKTQLEERCKEIDELKKQLERKGENSDLPEKCTSKKGEGEEEKPVTYDEALEELGGEKAVKEYKEKSEAISNSLCNDEILDKELQKILHPDTKWKSFSKKLVNQPYVNNLDELYELAEAKRENFEKLVTELKAETNSDLKIAKIKSRERAMNKAKFKYKDHTGDGVAFYRLTDILRATLIFEDLQGMYDGVEKIFENKACNVREFNDRYQKPFSGGYRDIQIVFELDGFICELQLSTKIFMHAKRTTGHRNYEVNRQLIAAVDDGDLDRVKDALEFGRRALGTTRDKKYLQNDKSLQLLPHRAAKAGKAEILDCLLENGADPDAQDENGDTPLHHAISNGHERCVWLLVDKSKCNTAIKNKKGECPLLTGYFMLHGEEAEANRRAMATLLQKIDTEQIKETISIKDKLLEQKLHNSRQLVTYAADGDIGKMKEVLKKFGSPNSEDGDETALQAAVYAGNRDAVELLLKFSASVKIENIVQEALDRGHYDIVNILIEKGAHCKDTTWKVLVDYAEEGNIVEMEKLLKKGINPDSSKDDVTALQAAVRNQKEEAVQLLLEHKASTDDRKGHKSILQEAIDLGNDKMKDILINFGTGCNKLFPLHRTLSCKLHSSNLWNWNGIASYKKKIFCAPHNAPNVLVVDTETNELRKIALPEGIDNIDSKWNGIVRQGTKLFCAPANAEDVLVIDGDSEDIHTIPCGVEGSLKWFGIAKYNKKLFCAPYNASSILVIDAETEDIYTIPCNTPGKDKWCGIASYGSKLFCAPYKANEVLVIDGDSEVVENLSLSIDPSREGGSRGKWSGIARYENKLYCAPCNASSVLVIDGDTKKVDYFSCGTDGSYKWRGIARFGDMLVCAPYCASSVLIIDGKTDDIIIRESNKDSHDKSNWSNIYGKWNDIAQSGHKLLCSPGLYNGILVFKDQTLRHTLIQMRSGKFEQKLERSKSSIIVDFARKGDIDKLNKALSDGAICPSSTKDGETALDAAVSEGNKEVVEFLIKKNAIRTGKQSVVKYAKELGHDDIATLLCKSRREKSRYHSGVKCRDLVKYASKGNIEELIRHLIEWKVDPNTYNEDDVSALQAAIRGQHQEAVKLLLDHGASLDDDENENEIPIMQEALDFNRNIDIARLLKQKGASINRIGLSPRNILLEEYRDGKNSTWSGSASYKDKVFFAPHDASFVLIIETNSEEVRAIPCGVEGMKKYHGITCYGSKLFCAPYNASEILVIDGDSEEIRNLPLPYGLEGEKKWNGIAVIGKKIFCAPFHAESILIIDGDTEVVNTIPCGIDGRFKWAGIASCGTNLFCAPYNASCVLVINGESEEVHTIEIEEQASRGKFSAIACYNDKKLYCAPWWSSSVLAIDGETEEIQKIPIDIQGGMKYHSVAQIGEKIYFPPCMAASTLIIDGETDGVSTQKCTIDDDDTTSKWNSATKCGDKLFCGPFHSDSILILENRTHELD